MIIFGNGQETPLIPSLALLRHTALERWYHGALCTFPITLCPSPALIIICAAPPQCQYDMLPFVTIRHFNYQKRLLWLHWSQCFFRLQPSQKNSPTVTSYIRLCENVHADRTFKNRTTGGPTLIRVWCLRNRWQFVKLSYTSSLLLSRSPGWNVRQSSTHADHLSTQLDGRPFSLDAWKSSRLQAIRRRKREGGRKEKTSRRRLFTTMKACVHGSQLTLCN